MSVAADAAPTSEAAATVVAVADRKSRRESRRSVSDSLMRLLSLALLIAAAGCGKDIGDACVLSTDCDPNGGRECENGAGHSRQHAPAGTMIFDHSVRTS